MKRVRRRGQYRHALEITAVQNRGSVLQGPLRTRMPTAAVEGQVLGVGSQLQSSVG